VEELAFLPVTTLAELIRQQRISSTELTMMYLSRLKRYGDSLKCVVTLTEKLALDQAARADAELRNGHNRGPLHGIPWGAKDLLATKGVRTTWGAKPYETQVIDHDATVVERLTEAGAVLVAKLSMGALAQGGVWFGGSTRNPWNLERSSSGSSAGPGAATAAGLVGFSIGTETRGSIISPSAACGVTGLRPTYGRVSRYGAMALSWTMDKIGPMCRSVEDCALVFNEIYGSDGRDNSVIDAPFDWSPDGQLADLRIGYIQREFEEPPANASEESRQRWEGQQPVLAAALESLRGAGAILDPIEMPDFPTNAISFILTAEAAAAFDDLTRSRGIDRLTSQEPNAWPNTFRTARFIPAVEYIRAQRARTLLMRRMNDLMSEYDVFISPSRSNSLGITNLTGHPAIAVKAGFANEMPVSLMITGRLFEEATILRAALAFERATPWHTQHPAL
jgi:Asp-tRNA(Asn)/Glu-tRNA(Gln) amidotransferase A subunit family amidase